SRGECFAISEPFSRPITTSPVEHPSVGTSQTTLSTRKHRFHDVTRGQVNVTSQQHTGQLRVSCDCCIHELPMSVKCSAYADPAGVRQVPIPRTMIPKRPVKLLEHRLPRC